MFKRITICSLLIISSAIIPNTVFPRSVTISDQHNIIPLGLKLDIFEDKEKKYTIDDITSKKISEKFTESTKEMLSYGFSDSAYWARFTIDSQLSTDKVWILELSYPLMDHVELYIPDSGNKYTVKKTGYQTPFSTRDIKHRNIVFKLDISPDHNKTYYLRFENEARMEIPLTLYSSTAFQEKDHIDQFILGIYYGIMFIMFIYIIILFLITKDRSYLYYVFFITAYSFFQLTQNGLAYEFFWHNISGKFNHYIPLSITLVLLSLVQFSQSLLITKINIPKFDKYFQYFKIILAISILTPIFLTYKTSNLLQILLTLITMISVIYIGIISILKKYRPAKFFMIAWSTFLLGAIFFALKVLAVLPNNYFTTYAIQVGSIFCLIFFSFSLGESINLMQKEKHIVQKELLESQMRENENLHKSNKEIAEANKIILLSGQKYKSIVESSNDIIFSLDEKFNFISANKAIKTVLKINPESVQNLNFLDLVYEGIEGGASEFFAKQMVSEKLDHVIKTNEQVSFTIDMFSRGIIEPKEMNISLEFINIEGKNEILGRATSAFEDTLLKFFQSEKQMYSIGNFLITADEISYRATKNLRKYMDTKDINMLRIALREILINSIEHGNLDITFEEKAKATKNGTYLELISRRQRDPRYADKRLEIEYMISSEKAVYKVADEGRGFDYEKIFNTDLNELNKNISHHGRGIMLAKSIFDEITYNKKGNQVLLVKHFK